jgi:hypothetical protein
MWMVGTERFVLKSCELRWVRGCCRDVIDQKKCHLLQARCMENLILGHNHNHSIKLLSSI